MIQTGDRFVPAEGDAAEAIEVSFVGSVGLVDVKRIRDGLAWNMTADALLDARKWIRSRDTVPAAPSTVGMERKSAKWRPSLVPSGTLEAIALAMQAGIDAGHVEGDWKTREASVFVDAAIRHGMALLGGEEFDESGLHHLDHFLASAAIARHLKLEQGP